jgi:cell shape-determining protein MreC
VPNSDEIAKLNQLLSDIKVLVGSLSILDKATLNKDQVSLRTALDAINFRVREINETVSNLRLKKSLTNPTNPTNPKLALHLEIEQVLVEVSKPNPDAKVLHSLLDDQLESLRKIALSEILTLSIE